MQRLRHLNSRSGMSLSRLPHHRTGFWPRWERSRTFRRIGVSAFTLCAALAAAAGAVVLTAEQHSSDDVVLHAEALGLLVMIVLISVGGRVIAGRTDGASHATVDTSSEELLRAKNAAEAASAAKSRYLASVSHEIRSPLNSIYGYAQLVERGDSVSATEAARVIARSAEHLTNLVEGLLDISQVENGILRVNNDVVRFPAFLDQIVSMFRPSAQVKGLTFRYEPPARLPEFVRVDQKRLRQVLINLLSNAVKYTERGEVVFRVSYAGQIARFEVIDSGPGIPSGDQQRIFMPFARGGEGEGHAGESGVGLGLPITRAIVQILGGNLELESAPGKGSNFRVTMMLNHVAGKMQEVLATQRITGYEGDRKSILVIDDDVAQLSMVRRLLDTLGFDVRAALGGEGALALCGSDGVDLALLDISMPGISGWDTAIALRGHYGDRMKIVMLSANADERFGVMDGPPLHDLFLVKPVDLAELLDAIGRQLDLRWIREPASTENVSPRHAALKSAFSETALAHIAQIREHLRIGYVRGIESEIKRLAEAAPEADDLVRRLFACLDSFDLHALAAQLEEYDNA